MANKTLGDHRHVLQGSLLTGQRFDVKEGGHKHALAGGEWTSVNIGGLDDGHTHGTDSKGRTSPPTQVNDSRTGRDER